MSKIPCRKCPGCGLYHGVSALICDECGRELKTVPALLVETEEIPGELYGEINEDATVYVQKCSACGALNFSAGIDEPVKVCYNCHKTRIASIIPVEYVVNEGSDGASADSVASKDSDGVEPPQEEKVSRGIFALEDDEDDEDDDSSQWQNILGNIRQTVGAAPIKKSTTITETSSVSNDGFTDELEDEDDDEDDADWSGILGGKSNPTKTDQVATKNEITLTAIRYGRLSFTIEAKDNSPYMLGRSANQSSFLSKDGRVGNEHCYIFFRDGFWYVKDNHSANGTAVNSRDIGLTGEHILNDGDELKLGHHPDSMAFRITL